jgi:hypothetical protein
MTRAMCYNARGAFNVDWDRIEHALLRPFDPVKGDGFLRLQVERLKPFLRLGLREYFRTDFRASYLMIAGMVLLGIIVNFFMPHGWTVWPLVLAASLMLLLHEAADRNGVGLPPLLVYAFFAGAIVVWLMCIAILSLLNPIVLLIGVIALGYYSAKGYLQKLEAKRIVTKRRQEGCCIFCGHPADSELACCMHCGREPDPDDALLRRVGFAPRAGDIKQRARAALKPLSNAAVAKQKEQALLERRLHRKARRK